MTVVAALTWVVARTKTGSEARAVENLDRQGFSTYCPMIYARKRELGRWVEGPEPLFPDYVFLGADIERQSLHPVKSTKGVLGLVRFGQTIAVVPARVIDAIRARGTGPGGLIVDQARVFIPGERIEVTEGRFAGLLGIFHQKDGRKRALVLLDYLGSNSRISIPLAWISKA